MFIWLACSSSNPGYKISKGHNVTSRCNFKLKEESKPCDRRAYCLFLRESNVLRAILLFLPFLPGQAKANRSQKLPRALLSTWTYHLLGPQELCTGPSLPLFWEQQQRQAMKLCRVCFSFSQLTGAPLWKMRERNPGISQSPEAMFISTSIFHFHKSHHLLCSSGKQSREHGLTCLQRVHEETEKSAKAHLQINMGYNNEASNSILQAHTFGLL